MSIVYAKFEPGREWIMHLTKVPLTAMRPQDCQSAFVQLRNNGASLEVGSIVAECLRNDKGVQVAVVMPNGYCLPTGRIAPAETWFPMLKSHLRQWLAMSPPGRIVRIVGEVTRSFQAQFEAGHLTEATYRQSVAKLEEFRTGALGELPANVSHDDILAAFYNWVTETAAQARMSQPDLIALIDRALRTGKTIQVPDLDTDLLKKDFQRFLDM